MTVTRDAEAIRLTGRCRVEEAETLVQELQRAPDLPVDLSGCEALHAAVAQVLLAFGPRVTGAPADPFLRGLVMPALGDGRQRSGG